MNSHWFCTYSVDTSIIWRGIGCLFTLFFQISELANNNSTMVKKIWISVSKSWFYLLGKNTSDVTIIRATMRKLLQKGIPQFAQCRSDSSHITPSHVACKSNKCTKTDTDVRRAFPRTLQGHLADFLRCSTRMRSYRLPPIAQDKKRYSLGI